MLSQNQSNTIFLLEDSDTVVPMCRLLVSETLFNQGDLLRVPDWTVFTKGIHRDVIENLLLNVRQVLLKCFKRSDLLKTFILQLLSTVIGWRNECLRNEGKRFSLQRCSFITISLLHLTDSFTELVDKMYVTSLVFSLMCQEGATEFCFRNPDFVCGLICNQFVYS